MRVTSFVDPAGELPMLLPRLGKIGLGIKVTGRSGKEHPQDVDYFVLDDPSCRPIIRRYLESGAIDQATAQAWAAGKAGPKELPIVFTSPRLEDVAPRALEAWANGQCRCRGNGAGEAWRAVGTGTEAHFERYEPCPCDWFDSGKCSRVMRLMVMLPHVSIAGCWQIDTGSRATISAVERDLAYISSLFGTFSGLMSPKSGEPLLRMIREPWTSSTSKVTHYCVRIRPVEITMTDFVKFRRALTAEPVFAHTQALPGPEQPRALGNDTYLDGSRAQAVQAAAGTSPIEIENEAPTAPAPETPVPPVREPEPSSPAGPVSSPAAGGPEELEELEW